MHVQAITTRYVGPSNTKPSRIIARACAGRIMVSYDSGLSVDANHDHAARKLAAKFGWHGRYFRGGLPDENGNVYVCDMSGECDSFSL